jgi:hypothetical protein
MSVKKYTIMCVLIAFCIAAAPGCSGKKGEEQKTEEQKAPAPSSYFNKGAGVLNSGFEERSGGMPAFWCMELDQKRVVTDKSLEELGPRYFPSDTEVKAEGKQSISFRPANHNGLRLFQQVRCDLAELAGKRVEFSCQAWANKPKKLRIGVMGPATGHVWSKHHPGDGEWHELSLVFTPAPADNCDYIKIYIYLEMPVEKFPDEAYRADAATLKVIGGKEE